MSQAKVPTWVNIALIPVLNIMLAFLVSGLVILAIGENPIEAAGISYLWRFWLRRRYWLHALLRNKPYFYWLSCVCSL